MLCKSGSSTHAASAPHRHGPLFRHRRRPEFEPCQALWRASVVCSIAFGIASPGGVCAFAEEGTVVFTPGLSFTGPGYSARQAKAVWTDGSRWSQDAIVHVPIRTEVRVSCAAWPWCTVHHHVPPVVDLPRAFVSCCPLTHIAFGTADVDAVSPLPLCMFQNAPSKLCFF